MAKPVILAVDDDLVLLFPVIRPPLLRCGDPAE
jgi:hypothetical protein